MTLDGEPIAGEHRPQVGQGRGRSERWERWAWVLLVAFVAAVFARTIRFGLFQDDYVLARPWSRAEVFDAFHGPFDPTNYITAYFRPLSSLSFALDWHLWGTNIWGYHLVNVSLHAAAVVCVWALLRRVRVPWWAAVVGAGFFALVPANVATAVYIAERTDAMVAIAICLGMLSLYRFHRTGGARWLVWMNLAYVVGLLAKEEATAIVPFAIVFWLYLQLERTPPDDAITGIWRHWENEARLVWRAVADRAGRGAWLRIVGPLVAVTVVYLAYRQIVMPAGSFTNRLGETQNPVLCPDRRARQRGQGRALGDQGLPAAPDHRRVPRRVRARTPRPGLAGRAARLRVRGLRCAAAVVQRRCRAAPALRRGDRFGHGHRRAGGGLCRGDRPCQRNGPPRRRRRGRSSRS